jgi:hypothetical protein
MRWPTENQSADDRSRGIRCAPGPSVSCLHKTPAAPPPDGGRTGAGFPRRAVIATCAGTREPCAKTGWPSSAVGRPGRIKAAGVSGRPDCFTVLEKPRGACTPLVHKLLGCRSHGQLLAGGQAKQSHVCVGSGDAKSLAKQYFSLADSVSHTTRATLYNDSQTQRRIADRSSPFSPPGRALRPIGCAAIVRFRTNHSDVTLGG